MSQVTSLLIILILPFVQDAHRLQGSSAVARDVRASFTGNPCGSSMLPNWLRWAVSVVLLLLLGEKPAASFAIARRSKSGRVLGHYHHHARRLNLAVRLGPQEYHCESRRSAKRETLAVDVVPEITSEGETPPNRAASPQKRKKPTHAQPRVLQKIARHLARR